MKRGESYGGGQSSLGYLFGSDKKQQKNEAAPPPTACMPPYGIDIDNQDKKQPEKSSPSAPNRSPNVDYPRSSGNLISSGRPSTKVKSVPGGDSSLGYLFGEKS